ADRNRSHWSTSKTPSYTKSVSWHHHQRNYINLLVVLTIKIAKATDRTVFAHQANIINTDLFCVIKK
ncbi:hypothetical protein VSQ33_17230, partial [Escherichia coli]|uniref:hypothetical protein n=1 Tax=Escherichia coli TaxID=562 RepID=UPI002DBCC04C